MSRSVFSIDISLVKTSKLRAAALLTAVNSLLTSDVWVSSNFYIPST
jgi:hypothetical protein